MFIVTAMHSSNMQQHYNYFSKVKVNYCVLYLFYRCSNVNRLLFIPVQIVIRLKVAEGQAGTIHAYVLPRADDLMCRAFVVPVRPLCLHHRVNP